MTIVNPRTSTRTIKKIGRSGLRSRTCRQFSGYTGEQMKAVAIVALLAGCFGYDPSAKKWAYVGDTVLIIGGAAAIGADLATRPGTCTTPGCYNPPFDGGLVAGAVL